MRHLVTIECKDREAGDFDNVPEKWVEFAKDWFLVTPMNGEEILQAQQVHGKVTHKLTCRPWIDGITNKMRVNLNGRILNIVSAINVDERNRTLELMCLEVV